MRHEAVAADYSSAAEAWVVLEMTKEMIRHREECIRIAIEYARRERDESNRDSVLPEGQTESPDRQSKGILETPAGTDQGGRSGCKTPNQDSEPKA